MVALSLRAPLPLPENLHNMDSPQYNKEFTIKAPFSLKGFSIISQKICEAVFLPSEPDSGIVFKIGREVIPADHRYIDKNSSHTTNLVKNGKIIRSVEHLLGAIWGMGVDNVVIEISEDGIPFFDFSAKFYAQAIKNVGIIQQSQTRNYFFIKNEFKIVTPQDDRYAIFSPTEDSDLIIDSIIEMPPPVGNQAIQFIFGKDDFLTKIAWARSFIRTPLNDDGAKWQRIRKMYPLLPENPADSPLVVYDDKKYITRIDFKDEPARHKLLDFLGDISLLKKRVAGKIFLYKPGHKFNYEIITELLKRCSI